MDVRQQDVERIVVEVLKKMMSDQPTAAATTVVAASGCDCGDFGLFDRLEDAVQAAEAAQKKISTVAMRDKIIAAIRKAGLENAKAFAEIAHNETGMGRVSDKIAKNILVCERTPGTECLSPMAISGDMGPDPYRKRSLGRDRFRDAVHQPDRHGDQQRHQHDRWRQLRDLCSPPPTPSVLPRRPFRS